MRSEEKEMVMTRAELLVEVRLLRKRINALEAQEPETEELRHMIDSLFKNSPIGLYIVQDGLFKAISSQFTIITGYSEAELISKNSMELVMTEDKDRVRRTAISVLKGEHSGGYEFKIVTKTGERRTIREIIASIQYQGRRAVISNFMDITDLRNLQEEQERLILQLQNSLIEVKTLSGLLPICAWCNQLRDEEGYWKSVEDYISQRTGAEFTHGMCPSCQKKLLHGTV